ncbi:MAG TPA: hypothetical protein VLG14_12655 [Sphingomonas sp.]|nr:hypothetical protein [Sphingomonas sp.]
MRHKTLASLLLLCGSTAALAHIAPGQTEPPVQNEVSNQAAPAPETTAPETTSNTTDVEPSSDPTNNGTETAPEPNSTFY